MTRILVVVTEEDRERANDAAVTLLGEDYTGTFNVAGYTPTGSEPVTHWVANCPITEESLAAVQALQVSDFPNGFVFELPGIEPGNEQAAIMSDMELFPVVYEF